MKTLVYIVTCVVMLSVISCTSRNKGGDDVQVLMKDSTVISAPQRMQVSDTKVTITYKGREYRSSVVRRPDESLPVVTNEQGERFIDNSIALRITCGGKQIVDKVFTKESFVSLVDARFLNMPFWKDWSMIRQRLRALSMPPASAIRNPTFMYLSG